MIWNLKFQTSKAVKNESGFSLIEVAIGLMVIGILMVPLMKGYSIYLENKKYTITSSVTKISQAAILKYFEKNGVYPIPADPSIAQGTTVAGVGFGAMAIMPPGGWPACSANSTAVCQTASTGFGTAGAFPGRVLIGDIPFAALGIPYKSTVDGYGRKLKYAVTRQLTQGTFNDGQGAIEVLASNVAPTSIYPSGEPRSHFVVVSLGPNGSGAFTLGGRRTSPCNTSSPVPDEAENCDNDGIFRSNMDIAGSRKIQRFDAPGARQFDDYLLTTNTSSYGVWSFIPNTLQDMQSRNEGNIKIGACSINIPCVPTAHVDVAGHVAADSIQTSRICRSDQQNCTTNFPATWPRYFPTSSTVGLFSPTILTGANPLEPPNVSPTLYSAEGGSTGAGIRCYRNGALKGIWRYDEVCAQDGTTGVRSAARFLSTTVVGSNCPSGTFARGINIHPNGKGFDWFCEP